MLPENIVYFSIFVSLFAGYFYIRDTLKGKTKPNVISWFIWFLAPAIAGLVSIYNGGGLAILPIFMTTVVPLIVVLISFKNKNSYWELGILDYICLFLSLLAIVVWIFLKEGTLATIFAILADLIAFFPTYIKSYLKPDTETLSSYYAGSINPILSISTLSVFSFNTLGFAVYLFLANLVEIILVLLRRRFLKNKK